MARSYAPAMFFSVKNKHVSTHMSELVLPGRCRSESAESVALSALAPHRAARLLVSGQMPVAMAGAMRFEMAVASGTTGDRAGGGGSALRVFP